VKKREKKNDERSSSAAENESRGEVQPTSNVHPGDGTVILKKEERKTRGTGEEKATCGGQGEESVEVTTLGFVRQPKYSGENHHPPEVKDDHSYLVEAGPRGRLSKA